MSQDRSNGRIIVVDDDQDMREMLSEFLEESGYEVFSYKLGSEAFKAIQSDKIDGCSVKDIDLMITDLSMPGMDGLELMECVSQLHPEVPIILITAFGSIESAIEATRKNAYDYILKPFKLSEIAVTIDRAVKFRQLKKENKILRKQIKSSHQHGHMIGKSKEMRVVFDLINRVSQATANVLITGESGTGKELVARGIHEKGPRSNKPFVAINCTSIPETLLESELFGHAKGSFTGAIANKKGLFEEADGGTIFLDEIGDLDLSLQAKILRVIQEKKIKAVGANQYVDVDVRIITATHKDLKKAIKEGRFREDLYYRLSVIPIVIPPLRHRRDDIPLLVQFFLEKYAAANHSKVRGFTPRAMEALVSAKWEGNVRELENIIERIVVLCSNEQVDLQDLPQLSTETMESFFSQAVSDWPTIHQLERRYIELVLDKTGSRKEKAAQILGINRRTLYRKEQEFEVGKSDNESNESLN